VAPIVLSAILGFAFGGKTVTERFALGVSGASPALVQSAERAMQLPETITIVPFAHASTLRHDVATGRLAGGVVLTAADTHLDSLLIPIAAPGATHSPGYDVVDRDNSLIGQEWAESLAAALASRVYAGKADPGTRDHLAQLTVDSQNLGSGGHDVLDYFAPSIAIVFLFIGAGLGMRSLILERANGTLARLAASPARPISIVAGKLLAIFITGLTSILVVWGVTALLFNAHWGDPLGVLLMCVGATLAMCGLGVFLTSLARNDQEAFGIALIVGLFLALVGGNFIPAGALPTYLQVLSLGTPNGWALVGFGRLTLLDESAGAVLNPFLILCGIAAVTGALALPRVRRMVRP
jgi:ABC-type transport system involved in cytochrome c biogenesis permease component